MSASSGQRRGMQRIRARFAALSESIESRLWPIPLAAVILATLLGIALPRLDLIVDPGLPNGVDSIVFNGGAQTARSVLSSIAGSLITATSLTFSLTVVALQLASSQASPRVLRLFARDRQVHATLAIFLGTFAYSITVLRSVRAETADLPAFVPRLAVTTAFVLTLLSVVMLVFFLAHLAAQLRVETMLKDIHAETDRTIDLVSSGIESLDAYPGTPAPPPPPGTASGPVVVLADVSGFVTSIDRGGLVGCADTHNIIIEQLRLVGDNVISGTPLARWWPAPGSQGQAQEDADARIAELERTIRHAHPIGYERTSAQDVDFGTQQVVDIAVRALSPGVNDPTTAVHAIGHLSAIIARSVGMPTTPAVVAGSEGDARLITRARTNAEMIDAALTPVRHYGATDPTVAGRFLQVITDVTHTCPGADVRETLHGQLTALDRQLEATEADPAVAESVRAEIARSQRMLAEQADA